MGAMISHLKFSTRLTWLFVLMVATVVALLGSYSAYSAYNAMKLSLTRELQGHFSAVYPTASKKDISLELLSHFFENYEKRHKVNLTYYYVNKESIDIGLSSFVRQPLLPLEYYRQVKVNDCALQMPSIQSKSYAVCASAIKGDTGKTVAVLEVMVDAAAYYDPFIAHIKYLLILGSASILVAAFTGYMMGQKWDTAFEELVHSMGLVGKGHYETKIPFLERHDTVGEMARALNTLKQHVLEFARLTEMRAQEKNTSETHTHEIAHTLQTFNEEVSSAISNVTSMLEGMQSNIESASQTTKQASSITQQTKQTTDQLSSNFHTVASAAEELTASIKEIDNQVKHSATIARKAVQNVESTNNTVANLSNAVHQIGAVVSTITEIAEQTNLLALNATIEAARAGDAGKGFAVVATEVKQLAGQTEKATKEIIAQIHAIEESARSAIGAIDTIGETIREMDSISSAVSRAVQEQGQATQEISRSVHQAATGSQMVKENIANAAQATAAADQQSNTMLTTVHGLFDQGKKLQQTLQTFLSSVSRYA